MGEDATLLRLRAAGIPREAIGTTLLKENRPDLRAYIQDGQHEDKPIAVIVSRDLLPFYLVGKELSLSGFAVHCCELVDIHTALFSDKPDAEQIADTLEEANVICISGFYETEGRVAPFFTDYEQAYFRSWFMRRVNNGTKFVLQMQEGTSSASAWWSAALVRFIQGRCFEFGGKGK